jgi:FtsP/CotA-like multicopper oxidase with cupredoxin domain
MRFPAGSTLIEPENLFSKNGVLRVSFAYRTGVDQYGNTQFCYVLADGQQAPTLHLNPGDRLVLTLKNETPEAAMVAPMQMSTSDSSAMCGAAIMDSSFTNLHFHGTNTSPTCHQDEVIHTLINSGQSFTYNLRIPEDEPPGLYWYHPHVHGMSEAAVQGGASGAIVIGGIEKFQPAVVGLTERILILRDNPVPGDPIEDGSVPSWDISLNYIPIPYPSYTPVVIPIRPGERQFWRVVNAGADTLLDLQLQYDGVVQPVKLVALDGVPVDSQNATQAGRLLTTTHVPLPTASRDEFIVTGPASGVSDAVLQTLKVDTGPDGDSDPARPIAILQTSEQAAKPQVTAAPATAINRPHTMRFANLASAPVNAIRKLYFSEVLSDPTNPESDTNFFITVDGQAPTLFSPDNPPAITTTQGSVEDWIIENRSEENHEFHLHQTHFLLLERNGAPVALQDRQLLDVVQVPYWKGVGPYPSVKVRIDFRGHYVGDFVYHCHILEHEDKGMMAIIRVLPRSAAQLAGRSRPRKHLPHFAIREASVTRGKLTLAIAR